MANEQYLVRGTPLLFADTAQVEDVAITLSALATVTGRVSARYDQGTGAKPALWSMQLHCALTGTNIVGATVDLYVFGSDGTYVAGEVGTADAALATDKRQNGMYVGSLVVDQTTTNVLMTSQPFTLFIPTRYFSVGVWNGTTLPFQTSTSVHGILVTPLYWQAQ